MIGKIASNLLLAGMILGFIVCMIMGEWKLLWTLIGCGCYIELVNARMTLARRNAQRDKIVHEEIKKHLNGST